jgi:hypothetical protein
VSHNAWIALLGSATLLLFGGVAAAFVLSDTRSKTAPAVTVASPTQLFALPLADDPSALMLAQHDRDLLVGMAARPGGPVEIVALRAETPVRGDQVVARIRGQKASSRPCGAGCTRVEGNVMGGTRARVSVQVGASTVSFDLPARLPPNGEPLFVRMRRTMLALRSYRFVERLSSGAKPFVSSFEVRAPNRLSYQSASGGRAVIIGPTRWDFVGGRWQKTSYAELRLPAFMWDQAGQARIVARGPGALTQLVAYGHQPVPAWFRLDVDPAGHVIRAEMTAASHFMFHTYDAFDKPLVIGPPTRR